MVGGVADTGDIELKEIGTSVVIAYHKQGGSKGDGRGMQGASKGQAS
jgi:hypothetical protein